MTESPPEPPLIMVLDRHVADFDSCAFQMRRFFSDVVDRTFAAWAVAPERGRFIVYAPFDGFTMDQILSFADDEPTLTYLIDTRRHDIMAATPAGTRIDIGLHVTRDVWDSLGRRFGP